MAPAQDRHVGVAVRGSTLWGVIITPGRSTMKHIIEKTGTGLRITASVDVDRQAALLEAFGQCASGTCSCPTPQYGKLQAIDVKAQPGAVSIELTAKAGEVIDTDDIERCLDHTARQVGA